MTEFDTQENLLSLHFGRTFWLNEEGEFCSAPTFKNGKTHWEQWDYVSDWDMEGVDFDKLFDVHRTLIESRMYEQIYQGAQLVKCNPIEHRIKMKTVTEKRYFVTTKFEKYGTYTIMARSKEHAIQMWNDGDWNFDNYESDYGEYNEVIDEVEEEVFADTQLSLEGVF